MSARREVCRRKKIILSQQKVGESLRMEKSRCEGCVVGRIGTIGQQEIEGGPGKPGTNTKNISKHQMQRMDKMSFAQQNLRAWSQIGEEWQQGLLQKNGETLELL